MLKQLFIMLLTVSSLLAAININTASKEQLMQIKGIGEKKAAAIIEYRKKHGKFKSVEDVAKVKGIGEAIVKNLKGDVKSGTLKSKKEADSKPKKTKEGIKKEKKNSKKTKVDSKKDTKKSKKEKNKNKNKKKKKKTAKKGDKKAKKSTK